MFNILFNHIIKSAHADDVVGTIETSVGIPQDVSKIGDFASAIIRFFIIIAGLFTLWSFLSGGFNFISAGGDEGKIREATNKITMSLVGLVVIAVSFIVTAIASQLLFGDFTAILNPKFKSI